MPVDKGQKIRLTIDAHKIPATVFVRAVRAFFSMLDEITRDRLGSNKALAWNAEVQRGSAVIVAHAEILQGTGIDAENVKRTVMDAIRRLETGPVRPEHCSDRALGDLRSLAHLVAPNEIAIGVGSQTITHKSVAHINDILGWTVEDYGSIEGRLRAVTEKGSLSFLIYDDMIHQDARCYFEDEMVDTVLQNFRRVVSVTGLIRYRKNGEPVSIRVEDLTPLQEEEIPSADEVRGILKGL